MNRLIIADIKSPVLNGFCLGHFFAVARNYLQIFNQYCSTYIAGGPIYQTEFSQNILKLPYNTYIKKRRNIIKEKKNVLINCKKLFQAGVGDIIIIQQGADVTAFLGIALFYWRKSKLYMIQYSNAGIRNYFKHAIFKLASSKIDGIICPNETVGQAYNLPYCVVPDYIYTNTQTPQMKNYSERIYDLCFVGRLVEEKGIIEVAKKIARTKYKMIIAGNSDTTELEQKLQQICNSCSNIELHLGFITDNMYYKYIQDSKFCILNYQEEYSRRSSGVVLDSIFNNVPIIGKRCQALHFIEKEGLGFLFNNIEELNLDNIINEENYNTYNYNINNYKQKHQQYRIKLAKFLGIDM